MVPPKRPLPYYVSLYLIASNVRSHRREDKRTRNVSGSLIPLSQYYYMLTGGGQVRECGRGGEVDISSGH
jgi:hypothetical protein